MNGWRERSRERAHAARGFVKSLLRVPWVVSMFGLRQTARATASRDELRRSSAEMDEVSYLLENRLDDTVGALYRAGWRLQEGMVDAAFDLVVGPWAISNRALERAWRALDRS